MKFPRIDKSAIGNTDYFVKLLDEWRQKLEALSAGGGRTVTLTATRNVPFTFASQGKVTKVEVASIVGEQGDLIVASMGWLPGNGTASVKIQWTGGSDRATVNLYVEEQ